MAPDSDDATTDDTEQRTDSRSNQRTITYTACGQDGAVFVVHAERNEWNIDIAREVAAADLEDRGTDVDQDNIDILSVRTLESESAQSITSTRKHRRLVRRLTRDFDARVLTTEVDERLATDDQLGSLCDAVTAARDANNLRRERYGEDVAYLNDIEISWGTLSFVARERALEVVAEACLSIVISDGQANGEEDWADDEIRSAQHEAREWLQVNTNAADRVGVLDQLE